MRILSAAVASVLVASKAASAFTCGCVSNERASKPNSMRQSVVVSSTPDALGDYLAKAHEEKLRAVKDVETKKNAEIEVSMNLCCWVIAHYVTVSVSHSSVLFFLGSEKRIRNVERK